MLHTLEVDGAHKMNMRSTRISAWNKARVISSIPGRYFYTYFCRLNAWLSGVDLGKNSQFYGFTTFQNQAKSALKIGNDCVFRSGHRSNLIGINRPCIISAFDNGVLTIGEGCGFSGTVIGCFSEITLGKSVRCGANTLITDADWHQNDPRTSPPRPIVIKDNVWLGVNVIVLKGVTVGRHSVIGAGSVVTRDIPEGVVAAGNPCKVLRSLT